jgi:hypothetical protein
MTLSLSIWLCLYMIHLPLFEHHAPMPDSRAQVPELQRLLYRFGGF